MRVGLLLGSGNPSFGGVERHVIQLANGLVQAGHRAFILMGHPCPIDVDHGLQAGIEAFRLPVPDGRSFPAFTGAVLRRVRRLRPCVLHSHLTYGLAAAVAARAVLGTRLVHTEHFLVRKSGDQGLRGRVGATLRGRADALIFVSRAAQVGCAVAWGKPRQHVIYNGTDPLPDREARRPTTRLLYMGRLEPEKRVDLALALVRALQDEGYTLDVVGTGSLAGKLQRDAVDLVEGGVVRFHGWQADVGRFLADAGALIQPAQEGLGYSALEATAYGLPVVAPANSGAAEVVERTGYGAIVQDAARVDGWVEAIHGLSALPADSGGLPEVFHRRHMLAATMGVYADLWRRANQGA